MIRIQQINIRPGQGEEELRKKAAKLLKIKPSDIEDFHIVKRSLDARKKPEIFYSYTVDVALREEQRVWKNSRCAQAQIVTEKPYCFQKSDKLPEERPVVVGTGPAGLFCAYFLAKAGFCPIVLERGKSVEERQKDVERFWREGILNPESNVQFGEGGAGTFSDGKLNTLAKDKYGRNREVLRLFVKFGAPEEILYESKPHIGTDVLCTVVKRMREEICLLGGEVYFERMMTELLTENGRVCGVVCGDGEVLRTDTVVLAVGHSARNTFEMLYEKGIPMEAKPFAVGVRAEHRQAFINDSQYGRDNGEGLPAAAYKVAGKTSDGRGVYSFCMCPGGYVVNASSEPEKLCVNGMSYSGRDGENANSAIVVTVNPEDFPGDHPLAGVAFQRELEKKAYAAGKGVVPIQTLASFRACTLQGAGAMPPKEAYTFAPQIKGQHCFADLTGIFPPFVSRGIVEGMEQFGRKIKGFDAPDTLLSGVESRTSSPLRILRDEETLQSSLAGLYPCGEGAGYAGGITSAAMDGIRVAEGIVIDAQKKIK